jgi:adenylate kinase
MFMQELAEPGQAARAILDGFPRTVAQARALDSTLAERAGGSARHLDRGAGRRARGARRGAPVCPVCGTTYHVAGDPPRVPGRCDKDGTELVQREDDRPEVVRARLEKQVVPMLEVLDHYDQKGIVQHVDGRQPIDAVTTEILEGIRAGW